MFNVNASLIRFWEKEFDIIKPHKNKKGNRLFTREDVDNFHLIFHLVKEKGMTLKGAKQQIKTSMAQTEANFEIVKRLKTIRQELLIILDRVVVCIEQILEIVESDDIRTGLPLLGIDGKHRQQQQRR